MFVRHESPPLSVNLYHHFKLNSLYLVNHTIVIQPSIYFGGLSCRFCLSIWLLIFYLGYFVCYLDLLYSFNGNFVYCLSQLDQKQFFAVIIYLIILFHYLPFCNSVIYYLFSLT
jgi:hypothetical protein